MASLGKKREHFICTFFVKPSKNIKGVVREKPLEVKRVREKLSHCWTAHLLVVLMLVDLRDTKHIENTLLHKSFIFSRRSDICKGRNKFDFKGRKESSPSVWI